MDLNSKLNQLKTLCVENQIAMLAVFGSVARGDDTASSDIDLLVRLEKPISLPNFIALEDKFIQLLGKKVDLATEDALHPMIRENVMRDLKVIYEQ